MRYVVFAVLAAFAVVAYPQAKAAIEARFMAVQASTGRPAVFKVNVTTGQVFYCFAYTTSQEVNAFPEGVRCVGEK